MNATKVEEVQGTRQRMPPRAVLERGRARQLAPHELGRLRAGGGDPRSSVKKAASVMLEAHTKGRAVARSCHEELAELYEERLRAKGLMFGTEPVG